MLATRPRAPWPGDDDSVMSDKTEDVSAEGDCSPDRADKAAFAVDTGPSSLVLELVPVLMRALAPTKLLTLLAASPPATLDPAPFRR